MHRLRANYVLLLAFFGCFSSPVYAQVNLKTGYNISFLSIPGLDHLISEFNQSKAYNSPFSNLRWLHGFETGLRLKGGIHALELTYQGAYQSFKATGLTASMGDPYTDKLGFAIHSAAIGYQLGEGILGLGTDLQYQWYKAKYEAGQTQTKYKDVQNMLGFKFYLMLTLRGGNGVDMALQPYLLFPTKIYSLDPLSHIFGVETAESQDKWTRYGITVLFYNGAK